MRDTDHLSFEGILTAGRGVVRDAAANGDTPRRASCAPFSPGR
jgi:hypothetical protein